jgi:hypothetical protein
MARKIRLTLACGDYEVVRALIAPPGGETRMIGGKSEGIFRED